MPYVKADQFEFSANAFNLAGEEMPARPKCDCGRPAEWRDDPGGLSGRRVFCCDDCAAAIAAKAGEQQELF